MTPTSFQPLALSNGAHESSALLRSSMLDADPLRLESILLHVVSMTTDLGVEITLPAPPGGRAPGAAPGGHAPGTAPWRAQAARQLQPDGRSGVSISGEGVISLDFGLPEMLAQMTLGTPAWGGRLTLDCDSSLGGGSGTAAPSQAVAVPRQTQQQEPQQ
jgi:hypothetical protein